LILCLITLAVMIGWGVMGRMGLFHSLGVPVSLALIGGEMVVVALIWVVILKRHRNRAS